MKEFKDIESFIEHLALLAIEEKIASHHALEECAVIVEKRAKDKIGEYQEQAGPFSAWPELAESTVRDREAQGYSGDEPLLRTGAMRDSIGHTLSSNGLEAQIGSDSDVALWQEVGTSKIPPRSFLGGAMAEKLPEIKEILSATLYGTLIGNRVTGTLLGTGVTPGGIDVEA